MALHPQGEMLLLNCCVCVFVVWCKCQADQHAHLFLPFFPFTPLFFSFLSLSLSFSLSLSLLLPLCKQALACVRTFCTHVKNMFKGVTYGFRYVMKSVYAHFPINMQVTNGGKDIDIRNFLGEKVTRTVHMHDGVTVKPSGNKDELYVEGNDIEKVSLSAALIHQSCLVKRKDIRKFLDGIYCSETTTIDPMY